MEASPGKQNITVKLGKALGLLKYRVQVKKTKSSGSLKQSNLALVTWVKQIPSVLVPGTLEIPNSKKFWPMLINTLTRTMMN